MDLKNLSNNNLFVDDIYQIKKAEVVKYAITKHESYVKELEKAYDKISKNLPKILPSLATLIKNIDARSPCRGIDLNPSNLETSIECAYIDDLKKTILQTISDNVSWIDPTKPDYEKNIENLEKTILYLSSNSIIKAMYIIYIRKAYEELEDYSKPTNNLQLKKTDQKIFENIKRDIEIKEKAGERASEYIRGTINYLLENPEDHKKQFNQYIGLGDAIDIDLF